MENYYNLSPKMQLFCLELMEFIEDHPYSDTLDLEKNFKHPAPIIDYAIRVLEGYHLIQYYSNTKKMGFRTTNPYHTWPNSLQKIEIYPSDTEYRNFRTNSLRQPYIMPRTGEITFREIKIRDYLKAREFYDYETLTLFQSIGKNNHLYGSSFINHQLASLMVDETGDKCSHIYVAEKNHSILGIVSISNFMSDDPISHKLPCKNENIFNVNYIATRKEASNQGIAQKLLAHAVDDIFSREEVYAICYNPIVPASTKVMNKVFNPQIYNVHKKQMNEKDSLTYGSLHEYIITKKEQSSSEK